jgi:hypothetical protein
MTCSIWGQTSHSVSLSAELVGVSRNSSALFFPQNCHHQRQSIRCSFLVCTLLTMTTDGDGLDAFKKSLGEIKVAAKSVGELVKNWQTR